MEIHPDFVDVALSRPIDIDGVAVAAVRMREPTIDDQLAVNEMKVSEPRKEIALIANLCSLSPADVQRLPLRDYKRLQEAFMGFTV